MKNIIQLKKATFSILDFINDHDSLFPQGLLNLTHDQNILLWLGEHLQMTLCN